MNKHITTTLLFTISCIVLLIGCNQQPRKEAEATVVKRSLENKLGTHFKAISPAHFKAPNIRPIDLFATLPGTAIWGATGRDDEGNIYVGASTYAGFHNNAYLYQYNPNTKVLTPQGNVLEQLKKAQVYKEGMSQTTIHSKIYMADDGYLYFSSLDKLTGNDPTSNDYVGFLWRKKPNDIDWEHLLSTREALVAVNTNGRYVYTLGTPGHVLYQFDTLSRRITRVTVGSIDDHISRNFLVSANGNIFVPRLLRLPENKVATEIMEYDSELNLVDTHPIQHYYNPKENSQHGITSYVNMKNGDIYFMTSQGALYQFSPKNAVNHNLHFITFLDESDQLGNHVTSLFSPDGIDYLVGMGKVPKSLNYKWFIHEIGNTITVAYDLPNLSTKFLLYGSTTGDNQGNLYIGGVDSRDPNKNKSVLLKLSYDQ